MPAFFNGVFGHKPSPGLVPSTGQHPVAHGRIWRYAVTGPLCRRAEDLVPLLRVLAGSDGVDPSFERPTTLRDPTTVQIKDLLVFDVAPLAFPGVTTGLLDAQERAAQALSRAGAQVRKAHFPELNDAFAIWSAMLSAEEGVSFAKQLGDGVAVRALPELVRWLLGRSPHTLPSIALTGIERIAKNSPQQVSRFIHLGNQLRRQLEQLLGDQGVLLFPSHSRPAPRHHTPLLLPIQWVYTAIFNVLEFAVTQVPLGLDSQGLPLGVQVASSWGHDHLTLAVARELERSLGGWVPPSILMSDRQQGF